MLDTISDLVGKVEKRARKPWITQEMVVKWIKEGNGKNVNTRRQEELQEAEERIEKSHR